MKLSKKDLLNVQEFNTSELEELIEYAAEVKEVRLMKGLENKSILMLLFSPLLHTRTPFEIAVKQLGGETVVLDLVSEKWDLEWEEGVFMFGKATEHVKDAARILSRYGDGIAVRYTPRGKDWREDRQDSIIKSFAKHASVPVINQASSLFDPCQGLADIMTIKEHMKSCTGWKAVLSWARSPYPEPMCVANSFALIATKFGMDLTIACPEDYDLDPAIIKLAQKNAQKSGGSVEISRDLEQAVRGAHIVYARSWESIEYYNDPEGEKQRQSELQNWYISKKLMDRTDGGYFMHSLPIRRNVVAMDEVLDSQTCLVYDQAENRLHIQKALLLSMIR